MKASPLLVALLPLLSLLVLAACDDDSSDGEDAAGTSEETTPATEHAPSDGRRQGGELTVASIEFGPLDPHLAQSPQDVSLQRMLWRGLYLLDGNNQVDWEANGIAAGPPEVSEEGTVYTVRLNEGLAWSDGDDLLAEDFVAGILRTCNPTLASESQYLLTSISGCDEFYTADPASADLQALQDAVGVRTVDDLTIEFTLQDPQPTFAIRLALWVGFPVPVHLERFAAATPDAPGDWGTDPDELAYNGPYVLTSYTPQDSVVVEPNGQWPGALRPTLDRINIRFISDFATATNAYRTGEVQVTTADVTQLAAVDEEFGSEHVAVVSPVTRVLRMQLDDPTLADLDVRLALARAIDRETLNRVVAQGAHEPTTSWIPEAISGVPAGSYDEVLGFDPEAAQAHLAAAGYPNGVGFPPLTVLTLDFPVGIALAEFLQEEYRSILNIDLQIEVLDPPTFTSRQTNKDFQLTVGRGWTQDYPDLENWFLGIFTPGGSNNNGNCDDAEITELVESAEFNPDDEERLATYVELERLVLQKVCSVAPYWHENKHYLVKPDLYGFKENSRSQDFLLPADWLPESWGYAE